MAVYVNNLVVNAGEDFYQEMTIFGGNGETPLTLTGYTLTSMIRKHAESTTKTADFTTGIVNATKGIMSLSLPSSTTSGLKEGRYVYDVLLNTGTMKSIIVEGMVLIRTGITS